MEKDGEIVASWNKAPKKVHRQPNSVEQEEGGLAQSSAGLCEAAVQPARWSDDNEQVGAKLWEW